MWPSRTMPKKSQTQDQSFKSKTDMTVMTTPAEEIMIPQNLELRNYTVEEAYFKIIKECRELLTVFDALRYRTSVTIDHRLSGKEANLQNEWISYFCDITLTRNKFGYFMIFFSYEEDAIKRFGDKQFNKFLRILFRCTDIYVTEINIEQCIRIQEITDLQPFFINRLLADPKDYVSVITEDKIPS